MEALTVCVNQDTSVRVSNGWYICVKIFNTQHTVIKKPEMSMSRESN